MSDRKETNLWSILAQPQSIYWVIRGSFFLSIAFWMIFVSEYDHRIWVLLAFLLVYSSGAQFFARKYRIPEEKLFFFTTVLDLVFITTVGFLTNRKDSEFFYLYFLAVPFGSYTSGLLAGFLLALLSSVFYLSINVTDIRALPASQVLFKILSLWILAICVGMVVNQLKNSKSKFLRMFDILNLRTSELEKSQAQIETIYETSRTLVEKLNLDEVVGEILNIVQRILEYNYFSLFILKDSNSVSLLGEIKDGEKIMHMEPKTEPRKEIFNGVVLYGRPVRILDVTREPGFETSLDRTKSFMAVPMLSRGKVIGIMEAYSTRIGAFLEQDEKIFSILAGSAALAIENAMLHQMTEELTIVDELTGLYNFRYFTRKLQTEIRRADRYQLPLSLIMVDIDWFKQCNDNYGHLFGNMVLRELASRINDSVRDVDIVCRYGGEEFVVILPLTKKPDAQMIGERIRRRVEQDEFGNGHEGFKVKITVSAGVASYPENGRNSQELIERMDQALYLAKGNGKNLVRTI